MQHQAQELKELREQIEEVGYQAVRDQISIEGIPEKKHENCIQMARNFFTNTMEISEHIMIAHAYRVGSESEDVNTIRPLHVKLVNPGQKGLIFKNVNKLTGKANIHKEPFTINDQVYGTRAEEQRRGRDIIKANNKVTTGEKLALTLKKR